MVFRPLGKKSPYGIGQQFLRRRISTGVVEYDALFNKNNYKQPTYVCYLSNTKDNDGKPQSSDSELRKLMGSTKDIQTRSLIIRFLGSP